MFFLDLGDKNIQIQYRYSSVVEMENKLDMSFSNILIKMGTSIDFKTISAAIWAGARKHYPNADIKQIEQWLDDYFDENEEVGIDQLQQMIVDEWEKCAFFPQVPSRSKDKEQNNDKEQTTE